LPIATLSKNRAKPFGPELQVKQMLVGRAKRAQEKIFKIYMNKIN